LRKRRLRQQAQLLKEGKILKTKMLISEMAQTTKLKLRQIKLAHRIFLGYPSSTPPRTGYQPIF